MAEVSAVTQAEIEEFDRKVAENCHSEEDFQRFVQSNMLSGSEELNEEELDVVVGGMSYSESVKILTVAYWDLCVCGKKTSSYSKAQIDEAIRVSDSATWKDQTAWIAVTTYKVAKVLGLL